MPSRSVTLKIIGDATSAKRALKETQQAGGVFKAKIADAGSSLKNLVFAGGIVAFGKTSVRAFHEAELAHEAMANSLRHNQNLIHSNIKDYEDIAKAIQAKTAADDESVQMAIANLANFKLTEKQLKNAIPLVVDYARRTGMDVPEAGKKLGTAMLGNTRALKEVGIKYKSTGDQAKDFDNIVGLLREKVGGFAEEEGKSSAVQLEILKNRFNDLQEVIGQKIMGAFGFVIDHLNVIGPILAGVIAGFLTYKIVMLAAAAVNAIFGTSLTLAAGPIGLIAAAVVGLTILIVKNFNAIKSFLARWGAVIAGVVLGPIGFLITALVTNFGGLRTKLVGIFKGIAGAVVGAFDAIRGGLITAINWVIRNVINRIIGAINSVIRGINRINPFGDIPQLEKLAEINTARRLTGEEGIESRGGNVRTAHAGVVVPGPRSRQVVTLLRGEERVLTPEEMPSLATGTAGGELHLHFHIAGHVLTERQLVEVVHSGLLQKKRTMRDLGLAS
jgi:hypothetical protein